MKYEQPSTGDRAGSVDSFDGESEYETDQSRDERALYGEPHHEVETRRDEQTLYGEPQHETGDGHRELPDLELLFARMRTESGGGPTAFQSESDSPMADATER